MNKLCDRSLTEESKMDQHNNAINVMTIANLKNDCSKKHIKNWINLIDSTVFMDLTSIYIVPTTKHERRVAKVQFKTKHDYGKCLAALAKDRERFEQELSKLAIPGYQIVITGHEPATHEQKLDDSTEHGYSESSNLYSRTSYKYGELLQSETRQVEYKERVHLDKEIFHEYVFKYMCAFLNTEGGALLYGVKDDGKVL